MSNINSAYADFSVVDYTGSSTSLSSYNLSITPLSFIPIIPDELGTNTNIVWDLGDTNKSTELNTSYYYKQPGLYTVRLFIYDIYNQAILADVSKNILIKDYIEDTFNVSYSTEFLLSSCVLSNSIRINQSLPYYYTNSTINYRVSGANSSNYFEMDRNKYNHLGRYNALLSKDYIPSSNTYELVELKSINLPLTALYVYLENNTLVTSLTSNSSSIIAGFSGAQDFYYRDDIPVSRFDINFSRQYNNIVNSTNITLSGRVDESTSINKLSITSNGLDGDSEPLSSFNIHSTKFVNTQIPFVIKLKDANNNTIKNTNPFILSGANNIINISLIGNDSVKLSSYTIKSLQSTLTSLSSGGYFRGYFEYTDTITQPITGLSLSARATGIVTTLGSNIPSITGVSTKFDIVPFNYYNLYKKGEDFDGEANYKSLRFQESLLDKDRFFGDFLGSIFGGAAPDTEALSKKINERILNFIDNTSNIDTAEIVRLLSFSNMLDNANTIFDQNLLDFPNKIQRLVSLLSIKRSKLFGFQNQFAENFNNLNIINSDTYGLNLGAQVDPYTYPVIPGNHIVAYEKFSNQYTLLNTYQPLALGTTLSTASILTEESIDILTESELEILSETIYHIIDYNESWGWPLILPSGFTQSDIPLFYDFYEYNNIYANNYIGGVLDMNITDVEPTQQSFESIYNTIILDTLYQSLSLTPR
jgi:hypothetical protein